MYDVEEECEFLQSSYYPPHTNQVHVC